MKVMITRPTRFFYAVRGTLMLVISIVYGIAWILHDFERNLWWSYVAIILTIQVWSFLAGWVASHDRRKEW